MLIWVFILAYFLCMLMGLAAFLFVVKELCGLLLRRPLTFLLFILLLGSGTIWLGHEMKGWVELATWPCPLRTMCGHAYWLILHLVVPLLALWWVRRQRNRMVEESVSVEIKEIWDAEVKLCLSWLVLMLGFCLYLGTKAGMPMSATIMSVMLAILTLWLLVWNCWPTYKRDRICLLNPDPGISEEMSDKLQRDYSFNKLCEWIQAEACSRGRVVGIFGRWGSGKTFLVHYLSKRLKEFHFVSVNLWQCSNEKELWEHVLKALETAYFGRCTPTTYLMHYLRYLLKVGAERYELPGLICKSFHVLNEDSHNKQISCFKKAIEKEKVVLVLDNVERTEVDILNALLPLVERLRGLPGLTILLSVATESWNYGGRQQMMKGHILNGAIQKIVEYPYHMTALKQQHAKSFFMHCLKGEGLSENSMSALLVEKLEFDTPRQIVRVAQALSVCEGVYFNEAWNKERNIWTQEELKEKVLPIVKPILLLTILRSQYSSMYTLLSEQSGSWVRSAPLPDLKVVSSGRVAEQKAEVEGSSWYIEMLRKATTRGYNNKLRYKMLAEEVLDYTHDLLFSSVLRQLNEQSAVCFIEAMSQTHTYHDELHPLMVFYIVQKCRNSGDVGEAIRSCFETQHDKIEDSLILALTQYVIGFINSSLRENQDETPNYVFVFMKLVSQYSDVLFEHLERQLNDVVGQISISFFLYYPYMGNDKKDDERFGELERFIYKLTDNRKAWVYSELRRIDQRCRNREFDSAVAPHLRCVYWNMEDFSNMMEKLYPVFRREVERDDGTLVWKTRGRNEEG